MFSGWRIGFEGWSEAEIEIKSDSFCNGWIFAEEVVEFSTFVPRETERPGRYSFGLIFGQRDR